MANGLQSELVGKIEDVVAELSENVQKYPATPYTTNSLQNLNLALDALEKIKRLQEI